VPDLANPLDAYGAAPKLRELRDSLLFGDIWEREQLSKRDRSLVTITVLMTQRCEGELRAHITRALANGVTREEIGEVITQVALYAGWTAGTNGSIRALEAFEAIDADD
jgi:4-carboxymuconolactone decarboxylase